MANVMAVEFRAEDGGSVVDQEQRRSLLRDCVAPPTISLKKGDQVMLIKDVDDSLMNGSAGKVIGFMDGKTFDHFRENEDECQAIETLWPFVRFLTSNGTSRDILCQEESWKIELPNGEVQASRSQVPLILAREHYQALVDIGSNGIRFSISDLAPPTTRITPTIYQDRSGVSLHDAQNSTGIKIPIPTIVIEETLAALLRFKRTCQDFGVHDSNVRVVATEATRNAINREHLLHQIREKTGWNVQLLAKEEEGTLGAMGIASSVPYLNGVCIDMGGGSVQLTWVTKKPDGDIDVGPSVSFPYGAAALMSQILKINDQEKSQLQDQIVQKIRGALEEELQIPPNEWEAAKRNGGFELYLSGGGLRGWGYILMSQDTTHPYPIPIINGYSVRRDQFFSGLGLEIDNAKRFRISSRRASQIPAVKMVIEAIERVQIPISKVTFAQGSVCEGLLYSGLPPSIRAQHPLVTSTLPYAQNSTARLFKLMGDAVPYNVKPELLEATVNLLYYHGSLPKDIQGSAALRCTTTGVLAGAHGLSHLDRSLLGLVLCERWGGEIGESDAGILEGLRTLCGSLRWWARFIGRIAKGIAELFPAGLVRDNEQIVSIESGFPPGQNVSSAGRCWVKIMGSWRGADHTVRAWAKNLEKLGKRKTWVNGEEGLKIDVEIVKQ